MTELHWTEVDGVATVWADGPEPLRAGLLFRTGRADETLASAGQAHLIEHMAMSMTSGRVEQSNGFVGGTVTGFVTIGRPEEVSTFLAGICDALGSLPEDRLEAEKQIVEAENATRSYDVRANLLAWRFGASGHGLTGLPELGSHGATIEQLRERVARAFTSGNAVLWLSGPPPTDLRLRLPRGSKQAAPPLTPMQPVFPSWFVDDACGGIAAGATVARAPEGTIFCAIASDRLREHLRTGQSVSYAPTVFYEPLNADTAHVVLFADSDKDRREELGRSFGEVFEGLTEIGEAEIDDVRNQARENWIGSLAPSPADQVLRDVQRAAMDWILGSEFQSIESLAAEAGSVSAASLAEFVRSLRESTMFAMPGKAKIQPWIGTKAPLSMEPAVSGRTVRAVDAPVQRDWLVHGPDGVSRRWLDGSHVTVRYDSLAAAVCYEDGCVRLVGCDASSVMVEPTLWRDGRAVCREIRERVPPGLIVDKGARPAGAIPKPATTKWQRIRATGRNVLIGAQPLAPANRTVTLTVAWSLVGLCTAAAVMIPLLLGPTAISMLHLSDGLNGIAAPAFMILVPLILVGALLYVGIRMIQDVNDG